MFFCEKYKKGALLEKASCPDPHVYCNFRGACLIFAAEEERRAHDNKLEEKDDNA